MKRLACLTLLGCIAATSMPALAQIDDDEEAAERRARGRELREQREKENKGWGNGFWPTKRMVEGFLYRMTDEMAERYEFDDDQLEQADEIIRQRFMPYLKENRKKIEPLINQFFEAQISWETPDPDYVAEWAERALTELREFKALIHDTTDDFREFMTAEQELQLDSEMAAMEVGFGFAANRLERWSAGGFDPETEWHPDRRKRHERDKLIEARVEHEMKLAERGVLNDGTPPLGTAKAVTVGEAPGKTGGPAVKHKPKGEWEKYVDQFLERYRLSDGQKAKAFAFLSEHTNARDKYLRGKSRAKRLAAAEESLKKAKTDEERDVARKIIEPIKRRIAGQFEKLKNDLDTLPTRAQRAAAAQREAAKHSERKANQKRTARKGGG